MVIPCKLIYQICFNEGGLRGSWPAVDCGKLYSSSSTHVQFTSLTDYAESFTFVAFLFWIIENCKSAIFDATLQFRNL